MIYIYIYIYIYESYKQDLELNSLQELICHKTQATNPSNPMTVFWKNTSKPPIFQHLIIQNHLLDKVDKDQKSVTLTLFKKVRESRFLQDFTVYTDNEEITDMHVNQQWPWKMVQYSKENWAMIGANTKQKLFVLQLWLIWLLNYLFPSWIWSLSFIL